MRKRREFAVKGGDDFTLFVLYTICRTIYILRHIYYTLIKTTPINYLNNPSAQLTISIKTLTMVTSIATTNLKKLTIKEDEFPDPPDPPNNDPNPEPPTKDPVNEESLSQVLTRPSQRPCF